jgi:hypothetical protein
MVCKPPLLEKFNKGGTVFATRIYTFLNNENKILEKIILSDGIIQRTSYVHKRYLVLNGVQGSSK